MLEWSETLAPFWAPQLGFHAWREVGEPLIIQIEGRKPGREESPVGAPLLQLIFGLVQREVERAR